MVVASPTSSFEVMVICQVVSVSYLHSIVAFYFVPRERVLVVGNVPLLNCMR